MFDAVRAETLKVRWHRGTLLLIWIFPIVALLLTLAQLTWDATHRAPSPQSPAAWLDQSLIFLATPTTGLGRFLVAAFAALVFAGEYGWNTWKLVIPVRPRWQLIAGKWFTAAVFAFVAFVAADVIALAGSAVRSTLGGPAVPAALAWSEIVSTHLEAAGRAILPILYSVIWAGLFAVITRSVLAAVVLSMGLLFLEQLLQPVGLLAYQYFPQVTTTVLITLPPYHLANVIAFIKGDGLVLILGAGESVAVSQIGSLIATIAWLATAAAVTVAHFARQDLN